MEVSVNPRLFTTFGRDWRSGKYKKLLPESREYLELWQREYYRCKYGYAVGGKYISGFLYWYVNFGTIEILDPNKRGKVYGLPELRDVEFLLDYYVNLAISQHKGLALLSGRRLGKSWFAAGLVAYNIAVQHQKALVATGDDDKGVEFVKMVMVHLEGLHNTIFVTQVLDKKLGDYTFGYSYQPPGKKEWVTLRSGSILYQRSFGKNVDAGNGTSSTVTIYEEAGIFSKLKESLRSTKYTYSADNKLFGFPLIIGTGGYIGDDASDFEEIFENPDEFDLLAFDDPEDPTKKISLFIPGPYAFNEYRDEFGILDYEAAEKAILDKRAILAQSDDSNTLYREIQYQPLTHREAFLKSGNNIFPNDLINNQIEFLLRHKNAGGFGVKGELIEDPSTHDIKFKIDKDNKLKEAVYPVREGQTDGCLVVYEFPQTYGAALEVYKANNMPEEVNAIEALFQTGQVTPNTVVKGLYHAGVDPYAFDEANTSVSLGSVIIFKRLLHPTLFTSQMIVAEFTGRPKTTDDFYAIVLNLLRYYNCKAMVENNCHGIKPYFVSKNAAHLLCKQPNILDDVIEDSKVSREYGVHMCQETKFYCIDLLNNYLKTGGLEKIFSINLLSELLRFSLDRKKNFDRFIAFAMALIKEVEDQKINIDMKKTVASSFSVFSRSIMDRVSIRN